MAVAGLWISQNPPPSASDPFHTKPHILNSSRPCLFLALSPGLIADKPATLSHWKAMNSTIPGRGHLGTLSHSCLRGPEPDQSTRLETESAYTQAHGVVLHHPPVTSPHNRCLRRKEGTLLAGPSTGDLPLPSTLVQCPTPVS